MWIKILSSILTLSVLANADIEKLTGPCPELKPVENFDEQRYTGTWYSVVHPGLVEYACVRFSITFSPNTSYHVIGMREREKFNLQVPFKYDAPGHFLVNSPDEMLRYILQYYTFDEGVIVDTDYDKYSIHYGCKFDASDSTHIIKFSINVRENYVKDPAEQIAVAKAAIEASGLEYPDSAKPVSHENCDDHWQFY